MTCYLGFAQNNLGLGERRRWNPIAHTLNTVKAEIHCAIVSTSTSVCLKCFIINVFK